MRFICIYLYGRLVSQTFILLINRRKQWKANKGKPGAQVGKVGSA